MTYADAPPAHNPTPGWGQSLSTGAAGTILLCIEYARAGFGGWDTVQKWAAAMTREPIDAHPDACGLYRGAPAIAFTLRIAERPAFDAALTTLDSHIAALTRHRLEQAHERIDRGQLPRLREFDLIGGLTGLGAYLLHQQAKGELLRDVLSYLVRLVDPLTVDGETLPGWWTNNGPNDQPSPRWLGGHGNLGMAHGIAGPLALLAIAMRRGIIVAGHSEAIEEIYDWLDQWRCGGRSRTWWPGMISRNEWQTRAVQQPGPQRPSWCYGTPGLARAQQLAALAMADQRRQGHAETALATCITEEVQLSQLRDASLCHGWAGLIQTTWRAATDAGTGSELATLLPHLRARLEQYLHCYGSPARDGLMEGTAGINLARHSTSTDKLPISHWDTCMLLDG